LLLLSSLLLLTSLSGCAGLGPRKAEGTCGPPEFPYRQGWLGGDAAYSIPLTATRSIWLFGDSFVGLPEQQSRLGSSFVHNSIAVSECRSGSPWRIEYFWGRGAAGDAPHAFLHSGVDSPFWWLFDGFVHDGVLYIGLLVVEESEPRGPLNLPFRYGGMKLARITNPEEDPRDWQADVLPLSSDETALPGSTMVVHGEHLYLFTFLDQDATRYPRILARLPLAAFDVAPIDLTSRLEYLAADGRWKPGLDASDAKVLMADNASEMSVRFHSELGLWLAIYSYPDIAPGFPTTPPSDRIYLRSASRPEGPWSDPVPIYRMPELADDYPPGRDPNTICYAAKEHPQLAAEGELLITYVCNLFTPDGEDPMKTLRRLLERMDLYRPQVVSIPLEEVLP
jgi:hypothetical protein